MNKGLRRHLVVIGAALAVIGAFLVWVAYDAEHTPYTPPPGCEDTACPSHIFPAEELYLVGFTVVFSGVGLILAAAAVPIEVPLTRVEEETLRERIERTPRRLD